MSALPRIFFRADGKMNLRWWLTRLSLRDCTQRRVADVGRHQPAAVPAGNVTAAVLDTVGMLVTVGAYVMIAATIAIHRVPLSLWHQEGDKNAPVHIVTYGPYRWVRHPFYVSFILLLIGGALIARDALTLGALPLGLLVLDWTARTEEKKLLASNLGNEYSAYRARTGRFVPRVVTAGRA